MKKDSSNPLLLSVSKLNISLPPYICTNSRTIKERSVHKPSPLPVQFQGNWGEAYCTREDRELHSLDLNTLEAIFEPYKNKLIS